LKPTQSYYIAEKGFDDLFNAGVVRKDNEAMLDALGCKPLHFGRWKKKSLMAVVSRSFQVLAFFLKIEKNSLVFFHFPVHAIVYKWLLYLLKCRDVQTVAIIIDIDGLRDKDEPLLKKEIALLERFSYLVAHNNAMKHFLLGYLPGATILTIDLFDYPFMGMPLKRKMDNTICVAGDFKKANFVYQLNNDNSMQYNLYGSGYDQTKNPLVNYKGIFSPGVLPSVIDGSFGLVWDGNSVDVCDAYLKYNNPHKLSLYLASGLPVIVWEQSAVAALVLHENIGITIASIPEIEKKLSNISPQDYQAIQHNAMQTGEKVRKGFFLKNVIEQIHQLQCDKAST